MSEFIFQEKSNEELTKVANQIIDILMPFNEVEKYKVISELYRSLSDVLKKRGIIIKNG